MQCLTPHKKMFRVASLTALVFGMVACVAPTMPGQAVTVAEDPASRIPKPITPLCIVDISERLAVQAPLSGRIEYLALSLALFESGLAELPGVVPQVHDTVASPGFAAWQDTDPDRWTALLTDRSTDTKIVSLKLTLCHHESICVDYFAKGARANIAAVVTDLLTVTARTIGRDTEPVKHEFGLSSDLYAVLLSGRAAAVLYGLLPAPADDLVGDMHQDPIARAVHVDPSSAMSQWIAGRRAAEHGDAGAAYRALAWASERRASSDALRADVAAVLMRSDHNDDAWQAWDKLEKRRPSDARFALLRINTAIARSRYNEAARLVGVMPPRFQGTPEVLRVRVTLAETLKQGNIDELLVQWQSAAPRDSEPVRMRIRNRISEGALREAIELTAELASRGAEVEALKLRMALAVGLQDYESAMWTADALELPAVGERVRARAELENNPEVIPNTIANASDPVALVVRAEVSLREHRADEALKLLNRVLERHPYMPEALAYKAVAQQELGDAPGAAVTWDRLHNADPQLSASLLRAGFGAGPAPATPSDTATAATAR